MMLLAAARRWIANATRGSGRSGRREVDPADMGTAFGLDAITTLERETASAPGQPASLAAGHVSERPWSPFEPRPPRRSLF